MAKKKAAKKEPDEVFYVGMKDPIEIRRSLLESSKEMVQYLQRAEKFKAVRTEKAEEIAKLKEIMNDATKLISKLKTSLPKTKIRTRMHKHEEEVMKEALVKELGEAKEEFEVAAKEAKPAEVKKAKPKPASELEKLESELSAIESKLTKLV